MLGEVHLKGSNMLKRFIQLTLLSTIFAQFEVNVNPTGESHLVVLLDSVSGVEVGDQIGVFDASNGVLSTVYLNWTDY